MPLSPGQREQLANEVKKFASDLNLSADQKNRLRGMLEQAKGKSAGLLSGQIHRPIAAMQ